MRRTSGHAEVSYLGAADPPLIPLGWRCTTPLIGQRIDRLSNVGWSLGTPDFWLGRLAKDRLLACFTPSTCSSVSHVRV